MGFLDQIDDPAVLAQLVNGGLQPTDSFNQRFMGAPPPPNLQNPAIQPRPVQTMPGMQQQRPPMGTPLRPPMAPPPPQMGPPPAMQPTAMPPQNAGTTAGGPLSFAAQPPKNPLANVGAPPPQVPPPEDDDELPSSSSPTGGANDFLSSLLGGGQKKSSDGADTMRAALAGGLSHVGKDYGWTGLGAFAGGAGGALGGYGGQENKNREQNMKLLDQAIKLKAEGDRKGYYDSLAEWHRDQVKQGRFQLVPGIGKNDKGEDVPGAYQHNARTGDVEFRPGVQLTSRAGGGRDSVFQQRLAVGTRLYPNDPKAAADYAAGSKTVSEAEANKFGMSQAEAELKAQPDLDAGFIGAPDKRNAWKEKRAKDIAGIIRSAPPPAAGAQPGAAPQPSAPPPAAPGAKPTMAAPGSVPEISMKGNGTKGTPYAPQSADDYSQVTPGSYYVDGAGMVRLKK